MKSLRSQRKKYYQWRSVPQLQIFEGQIGKILKSFGCIRQLGIMTPTSAVPVGLGVSEGKATLLDVRVNGGWEGDYRVFLQGHWLWCEGEWES